MPFYEREEKILNLLTANEVTTVDEIAEKLYISKPTVRRDLDKLSKKGLIARTHGGAMLIKKAADATIPFALREQEQNSAKSVIARKAVQFIKDGDTVMLDGAPAKQSIVKLLKIHIARSLFLFIADKH